MYHDIPGGPLNFVHKRIIGGVIGLVTGGPGGAAAGFLAGGGGGRETTTRLGHNLTQCQVFARSGWQTANQATRAGCLSTFSAQLGGGGGSFAPNQGQGLCVWPARIDPITGQCKTFVGEQPGGEPGGVGGGQAVMGQYGAAMVPDAEQGITLRCLPGMVLGKDRLCYNKRDISNKERRWPKGTRPLGTPGEMACLRKAASFGRRMETTVKRMQKVGVLSKPRPRAAKRAPMRQIGPGGPSIINVE